MNARIIEELVHSDNIATYINNLTEIFCNTAYIINTSRTYKIISLYDKNNYTRVEDLELFVLVDVITDFLNEVNNLKYNIDITTYPVFQYIQKLLSKLNDNLINLLALDRKTKLLLLNSYIEYDEDDDVIQYGSYRKFFLELCYNKQINLSEYHMLKYDILAQLLKLNETLHHVKNMMVSLINSFDCFTICYRYAMNNISNNYISDITYKNYIIHRLYELDIILKKAWCDYINSNKITMFLQSLIQDADLMIVKARQNNDIEAIYKLTDTITIITALIHSYDNTINNNLIIVVDYSRINSFLLAILDYYFL